jgi:hypothetical protein
MKMPLLRCMSPEVHWHISDIRHQAGKERFPARAVIAAHRKNSVLGVPLRNRSPEYVCSLRAYIRRGMAPERLKHASVPLGR